MHRTKIQQHIHIKNLQYVYVGKNTTLCPLEEKRKGWKWPE